MTKNILALTFLAMAFASCNDDDDSTPLDPVQTESISNLYAPQTGGQGEPVGGEFTKFDFETGAVTTSETDWDIAFRGTTIAINGGTETGTADEPVRNSNVGVAMVTGTMASVSTADGLTFVQDTDTAFAIPTGSDNGWYNYAGPPSHLITPIPGKIFVFRTTEGNFAKVEIISYYENAPAAPDAFVDATPYYTFNYVYNPNEGDTSLE
ncbi:HmuY family protein [Maribacter confluentis]|uniref:HmuY family protein n=1 Tax=Maribacter confluentis TaxID=1656093 RepID=A0ABT8RU37_9FLAO|nr:HmuY family protein [Maribacter confluentis]MDO1514447.1 HmuY family protein [Maribacter confluentis]